MTELDEAWGHYAGGRFFKSLRISASVLQTMPTHVSALACHALSLWSLGREPSVAIAELERARDLAPESAAVRHNLATVLASVGAFARAAAESRVALQLQPESGAAFFELCQAETLKLDDPEVLRFEELVRDQTLAPEAHKLALFGLARIYDAHKQPERAMKACLQANAMEERPYDFGAAEARLARLRQLARSGAYEKLPRGDNFQQPIFIAGAPRSGTTLVESILAAHPAMHGAGESAVIGWFEHGLAEQMRRDGHALSADEAVFALPKDMLTKGAEAILKRLGHSGWDGKARIVEKTPANVFSVGLIGALFPSSRVIVMRRHPLDVGISNLFTRFQSGQGHAFSLEGVGHHLRHVAETASVWQSVAPVPVLEVVYERLAADPDGEIARILDFCGLEDAPECHKFFENPRAILTASVSQVRRPISTKSVGRWQRYRPWLDPMIEAMGGMDWITEYAEAPPFDDGARRGKG